jgi:hypothetical protein
MTASIPLFATLFAAGIAAGVVSAAPAAATPQCINTALTTTQCERPGNAQINTSPSVIADNYPFGWPWWGWGGGLTIGIGGWGGGRI